MGKGIRMLTVGEFRARFGEEAQCAEQMTRQRWPEGFRCPRCAGTTRGYIASRRVHECKVCAYQCSVTAGTIFHKTRTPPASWFWAIYRMSHDKKGISAMQLAKEIGVSYTTAWAMQHKIRKAMEDRDQRYKLHGIIEMDEGYIGGAETGEGRRGRGAVTKCVVAVAVEHAAGGQPGRPPVPGFAALQVLPDTSSRSIDGFLQAKVQPGSRILSDGWGGYRKLDEKGFEHTATVLSSQTQPAHALFPWVHIALSNLKRFLLGTHHQVQAKHLKRYVAEFNYRLNRRTMEPDLLPSLLRACLDARVRQIEPRLHKISPQHDRQAYRLASLACLGIVRSYQRLERRPGNHLLHLIQKQLPARLPAILLKHHLTRQTPLLHRASPHTYQINQ